MNTPAQQKIIQFFKQQEVLKERKAELIQDEKKKLQDNPVTYVQKFISKTDNVLTVSEVRAELEALEKESTAIIAATSGSIFISEFAASNHTNALQKLKDIDTARTAIDESLKTVTVQHFNETLRRSLNKYAQDKAAQEQSVFEIEAGIIAPADKPNNGAK
jgi:hypothetical protein